jgi:hypothetical protein
MSLLVTRTAYDVPWKQSQVERQMIADRKPGSVRVYVTRASDRPAREDSTEIIETTVAEIDAVFARLGVAPDEPATIIIEALENNETIRLPAEDQRAFADAMLNPPEPTPALQRAAALYRAILRRPD